MFYGFIEFMGFINLMTATYGTFRTY